jgi:hypothetical protein
MITIVVMARADHPGYVVRHPLKGASGFQVKKGDLGLLQWKTHGRHPKFMEPLVIWDKDRQRRARRMVWSFLTVVGLQTADTRILLAKPDL